MRFEIICTGWNCYTYVNKCVASVMGQKYRNWHLHLISDGSTDGTAEAIKAYSKNRKVTVYDFKENKGAALRRLEVIRPLKDDSVCILLGMDDEMLPGCLERIKKEYDLGKWMTYGNWVDQNGYMLPDGFLHYTDQDHAQRNYRKLTFRATGLNTFKKFLFNEIPDDDFKVFGKWIDNATETELMFSCLEMCGKERIGVIEEPIALYNRRRVGGTLSRSYELNGVPMSGKDYKYKLLEVITNRPKKPLYGQKRTDKLLTVGLPVLNMPAWLAMEGLCRQETCPFELIVFEDATEPNGIDYYQKYLDRMPSCERLIYVYSEHRVSLSYKWRRMAELMSSNSLGLVLQAADCYSEPNRLQLTLKALDEGADWVHYEQGYFCNVLTGQVILFDLKLFGVTGLNMAISKEALQYLPEEDKYSGVDNWLYRNGKNKPDFKVEVINSPTWNKGVDTDGWNRISMKRRDYYDKTLPPFKKTETKIEDILPVDVIESLKPKPQKKMKVLNISSNDWANYSYSNMTALRAVGVHADGLKIHPHGFGYEQQHPLATRQQIAEAIPKYDIVQIFNSDVLMLELTRGFKGKLLVYHTGTGYREKPKEHNERFNPVVWKTCIAHGEFAGQGAKNEVYIDRAVDTDKIKPVYNNLEKPYKFLHCPSSAKVKGTQAIQRMMEEVGANFKADTRILSHDESIERMKDCDIYVELFSPEVNGKKYGHFGVTAIEAAAMCKVVVTQNLSVDVYEKNYGSCPLILAKDEDDFKAKIKWLMNLEPLELRELQHAHRKWAVEKHSFKAMGEKLKRILEIG